MVGSQQPCSWGVCRGWVCVLERERLRIRCRIEVALTVVWSGWQHQEDKPLSSPSMGTFTSSCKLHSDFNLALLPKSHNLSPGHELPYHFAKNQWLNAFPRVINSSLKTHIGHNGLVIRDPYLEETIRRPHSQSGKSSPGWALLQSFTSVSPVFSFVDCLYVHVWQISRKSSNPQWQENVKDPIKGTE